MGLLKTLLSALVLVSLSVPSVAQVFLRDIPAPSSSAKTVAWDGEAFWVGDNTATLYRVDDDSTGTVLRTLTLPFDGTDGLAWDGEDLWVVSGDNDDPNIYKIDTTDGSVISSIPDMTNGYMGGTTFDETQLWASRRFPSDQIIAVDPTDGAIGTTYPAPGGTPWGMSYDGAMLWVSSEADSGDVIYRVDPTDGSVAWGFTLPEHTTLPDRRIRGLTWVDGSLWFVGFQQSTFTISLHEYDVSNAIQPDIVLESTGYEFGGHVVGYPAEWTVSIDNIGNVPLVVSAADFEEGTAFSLVSPTEFPVQISSFTPVDFVIQFDPPDAAEYTDNLTLTSNDPDEETVQISLDGTGLPDEGNISPSPTGLDFGTVWIPNPGLSTARTVEIHNTGSGTLTITNIEITVGDYFSVDPIALPAEIDSHSYIPLRVWFDPELAGLWNGFLTITSDDPDQSLLDISLTGSGEVTAFDSGDIIWGYFGATDDWDNGVNAVQWINDVNGDGAPDVLASLGNGFTYCLNGAGAGTGDTLWSFDTRWDPNHSGAVWDNLGLGSITDITGDGIDDAIIGTTGGSRTVYALSGETGEELWFFDTHGVWDDGGWIYAVHATEDLDDDFVNDVLVAGGTGGTGGPRRIFALSGIDGSLIWQGPQHPQGTSYYCVVPIADLDGDGKPEAVGGSSGYVTCSNGDNGNQVWQRNINGDSGTNSPVFKLVNMGNANPDVNLSEDVAVASAYDGIWSLDGATGNMIWRLPFPGDFVYEVCAGSDITGDDVREVYAGTSDGLLICIDGASGESIWQVVADPNGAENILSMTNIPDITGDQVDDVLCGTLGDFVVVRSGWDGSEYLSTAGMGPVAPMDAVMAMPDIDNNGSWEIIAGNRDGLIQVIAGGSGIIGPEGWVEGIVREFGVNTPIEGITVSALGTEYSTETGADGTYTLALPPDTYDIFYQGPGYCNEIVEGVTIVENVSFNQNATMGALNAGFSATSININVEPGEQREETFEISNSNGACPLEYSISVSDNWMSVNPSMGDVDPDDVQPVTVFFNTNQPAGDYQGQITIDHGDLDSPHIINVLMGITDDAADEALLPTKFELYAAYPNPFNPSTTIRYDLAKGTDVRVVVFDALGRQVNELVDTRQVRGAYAVEWNGDDARGSAVSTGMYFVRLESPDFTATQKVLLMK